MELEKKADELCSVSSKYESSGLMYYHKEQKEVFILYIYFFKKQQLLSSFRYCPLFFCSGSKFDSFIFRGEKRTYFIANKSDFNYKYLTNIYLSESPILSVSCMENKEGGGDEEDATVFTL